MTCCLLGPTYDPVDGMITCIRILGKYLPDYNTGLCDPTLSEVQLLNKLMVIMLSE
jgi:hypothetical protein